MGEEEKKPEEPKAEEKKLEEPKKAEEAAEEKKPEEVAPPPPPSEIVLKVFMHCEGCARKVRRTLRGFPGVEDVVTDCKSHKVVVKGEKADPLKVLERIQRKSHRQVELLSPIPKPPEEKKIQEEEKPKPEEMKEEPPIVTVLKVHMHCEACAQEIKRRIQRVQGVESAEPDLKSSQVSVKGVYDPAKLVEYVYKRTGKQAVIVKQEAEKKEKEKEKVEEMKEAKKEEEGEKEKKSGEGKEENKEKEKKEEEAKGEAKAEAPAAAAPPEDTNKVVVVPEVKINEYFYNRPRSGVEVYAYPAPPSYYQPYPPQMFSDENPNVGVYAYTHPSCYQPYPPQMFSDENPNACTVM